MINLLSITSHSSSSLIHNNTILKKVLFYTPISISLAPGMAVTFNATSNRYQFTANTYLANGSKLNLLVMAGSVGYSPGSPSLSFTLGTAALYLIYTHPSPIISIIRRGQLIISAGSNLFAYNSTTGVKYLSTYTTNSLIDSFFFYSDLYLVLGTIYARTTLTFLYNYTGTLSIA